MGPAEMLDRSRQEFGKRADTILSRAGFDFARGAAQGADTPGGRFFFDAASVDGVLALLRQRLPEQVSQIIDQADRICRHRFDLLGYKDLDYGESIDWHLDAVHAKRAPRKPFFKVRYLDFDEVGDSKVTWELNRHQHLVTLAKACRLTGEQRYVDEILRQWRHWHAENPYPIGINWASSLEVAFRSMSWCWVLHLLQGTPALPAEFHGEWLRAQAVHGRYIERYLSTYFSPNTHLLGEGVALFFLGTLCPQLARAERWKSLGWKIVLQESRRQVLPDGFHFERSTYYHVYALDFFLHATLLARVNGATIPDEFLDKLKSMLEALVLLGRAGTPPGFGDDDGGRVFDPRRNQDEHLLDPLATGAVLFSDGGLRQAAGGLREETLWLLGEQGVEERDRLAGQSRPMDSAALSSAGLYLLASPSPRCQWVVNTGQTDRDNSAHGHADALSVCCQANGHTLLLDPGTFEYVGTGNDRDRFRGTAMHSTLRVDDSSQSEPAGPFAWARLAHAKVETWIQGEAFNLLAGSHDGYMRLQSPVVHRRYFFSLKSGLLLVRDVALGEGIHQLDISWHLAAGLEPAGGRHFRMTGSVDGLAILSVEGHGWAEELRPGSWSPSYGSKQESMVLNFGTRTKLPAEFVTMLVPLTSAGVTPGRLTRIAAKESSGTVAVYVYESESERHAFFFGETAKPWKNDGIASDAEFVCRARNKRQDRETFILCNGSYLEVDGRRVMDCEKTVLFRELIVEF